MGCAITSAVFGGIIIICFAISLAQYHYYDTWYGDLNYYYNYDAELAITAITLILGIVEFAIGIWAAVLSCYITSCACCVSSPEQVSVFFLVSLFQILFFGFHYMYIAKLQDPHNVYQPSVICNFISPYHFSMLWWHLVKLSQANCVLFKLQKEKCP